jgi:hypothetical protein
MILSHGEAGATPVEAPSYPDSQVGRRWSAKPSIVGFSYGDASANDSHSGFQTLQCSSIAEQQAHNLKGVGAIPTTATKCTDGVTATSWSPKPLFWLASGRATPTNPSLCVLLLTPTR